MILLLLTAVSAGVLVGMLVSPAPKRKDGKIDSRKARHIHQ